MAIFVQYESSGVSLGIQIDRAMLPGQIFAFADVFTKAGYELYLVGGMLRDMLLHPGAARPGVDFDFASNALPEQVQKLFKRTVPTGIKHGTITVLFKNYSFEVTTYRSDGKYADGRHPESVMFSDTIEEDLKRRDFTVNAMALNLASMEVLDLYGGLADLQAGLLRAVGDPLERFREDGLRVLRACRFAAQLAFGIEPQTFAAIEPALDVFARVAMERVRDELTKIMLSVKPSIGLEAMRESGLLREVLPELVEGYGFEQNEFHLYDVYYHSIYSCDGAAADDYRIRYAALFHDIGKVRAAEFAKKRNPDLEGQVFHNHEMISMRMARSIMQRLRFSRADMDFITHLIKHHMFHYTETWTDGAVRRLMRNVGVENLDPLFRLRMADRAGNGKKQGTPQSMHTLRERIRAVQEAENAITVKDLALNGNDLMEVFGIPPSRLIGEILEYLLEYILDNPEANKREELLAMSAAYLEQKKEEEAAQG